MARTNPADFLPGQLAYNRAEIKRLQGEAETRSAAGAALSDDEYALKEVEYHNRKLQLIGANADFDGNMLDGYVSVPKHLIGGAGRLNPVIRAIDQGNLIKPNQVEHVLIRGSGSLFDKDLTDEADGTNLNRRPLMTPLPGFPMDELVNLPRFIMEDMEPFAFVNEPEYVPKSLQLPYPKILFELGPEDNRLMIVVRQFGPRDKSVAFEYLHTDRETPFLIGALGIAMLRVDGTMDINFEPYSTDPETARRCIHAIVGFIAEFSVGNTIIGTQARDPNRVIPPAGTTRKYRIVRIVMGVTKVTKPWQGGTHASPREHERMGHWRRIKGVPRWFPSVTVNKGVIGKVMKAYHVSKRKPTPDL